MTGESLDSLTLREKLSQSDHLVREFIDLLEHGMIPKAHALRTTAKQGIDSLEYGPVTDMTMRSAVNSVLSSGNDVQMTAAQITRYLDAIESDVQRIIQGG
jgi:hypothetical protein